MGPPVDLNRENRVRAIVRVDLESPVLAEERRLPRLNQRLLSREQALKLQASAAIIDSKQALAPYYICQMLRFDPV